MELTEIDVMGTIIPVKRCMVEKRVRKEFALPLQDVEAFLKCQRDKSQYTCDPSRFGVAFAVWSAMGADYLNYKRPEGSQLIAPLLAIERMVTRISLSDDDLDRLEKWCHCSFQDVLLEEKPVQIHGSVFRKTAILGSDVDAHVILEELKPLNTPNPERAAGMISDCSKTFKLSMRNLLTHVGYRIPGEIFSCDFFPLRFRYDKRIISSGSARGRYCEMDWLRYWLDGFMAGTFCG